MNNENNTNNNVGTYIEEFRSAYRLAISDFALALFDELSNKQEIDVKKIIEVADRLKEEIMNG